MGERRFVHVWRTRSFVRPSDTVTAWSSGIRLHVVHCESCLVYVKCMRRRVWAHTARSGSEVEVVLRVMAGDAGEIYLEIPSSCVVVIYDIVISHAKIGIKFITVILTVI